MKSKINYLLFIIIIYIFPIFIFGQSPNLRSTVTFALFTNAGAFDNVGASSVIGDIGSNTYTPTGFPPGIISGSIFNASDGQSTLAATDVALLYDDLSRAPTGIISPTLGGQVLSAGVYSTGIGAAADLTGDITLDAQGNPDALFIIRIDGALGVSGSANVLLINSASPNNVFWQINGAFSLGTSAVFRGTIVSAGAISLLSSSTLIGKGLTKAGAIDLNASTVITKLNPAVPTLTITQPTCTVATGGITISAPIDVGMTYSIDGFNYSNTNGFFSSLAPGNYNVTAKDIDGFISGITVAIINTQPPTPIADAGISKEICINSSALIGTTAKVGNTYLWSSMPSGFISDLATQFVSPIVTTAYTVVETVITTGCFSSSTIIITVKSLPTNAGLITGLTQVCKGKSNVIYTVPSILNATGYIWTLPIGASVIAGANTNRILVSYDANAVDGNVTVYGTNSCGIGVAQSIAIKLTDCSLADLSVTVTASNMAPIVGQTISLTIIANNLGLFDATGVTIDNSLLSGYSYLSSSSSDYDPFTGIWTIGNLSNGVPTTLIIMVKVNNIGNYTNTAIIDGNEPDINMSNNISTVIPIPTDFFLPEGFSPNQDGINDLFVIRGILSYPNNHFTIFNRWGNKVFETKQYRNTWNGKSTMGLRIGGDDLPTGTYFYLLDLGNGSKIIKGTIYLNR